MFPSLIYHNDQFDLFRIKDKLVATGNQLTLKEVNRHSHAEYECVARNTIEPDPSRHFKINVNCKLKQKKKQQTIMLRVKGFHFNLKCVINDNS